MSTIYLTMMRTPRIIRFVSIGGFCTFFQLTFLFFLAESGTQEHLANAIGFIVSTQINFALSHNITYGDRKGGNTPLRWLQYNTLAITILVCNSVAFAIANHFSPHYLIAGVLSTTGTLAGMTINYTVGLNIIFTHQVPAEAIQSNASIEQ